MKIFGIELSEVDPAWKMRSHAWLNMKTLKPSYSVQVKDPGVKHWAHIYTADKGLKTFKTPESAQKFINKLARTLAKE
ncbi:TPA: hypothetical protein ACKE3D_002122 [Burkholderia dolosa]